jgi:SAM-dependent methyltransferase
MCDVNCIRWGAKNLTRKEIEGKRVIEVGSYDVNGSLRYIVELLEPAEYIGVDVVEGPGVDMICSADKLVQQFGRENFDMVICTCTLEHIKDWKGAISNIKNICRTNGIILIIVPSDWPYHEFPYDFWRYDREDIENIFSDCDILALGEDPQRPSLVYVKMRKPDEFTEKDLSDYQLFSVIAHRRIREIGEKDLQDFYFKRLPFKDKIKHIVLRKGRIPSSIE